MLYVEIMTVMFVSCRVARKRKTARKANAARAAIKSKTGKKASAVTPTKTNRKAELVRCEDREDLEDYVKEKKTKQAAKKDDQVMTKKKKISKKPGLGVGKVNFKNGDAKQSAKKKGMVPPPIPSPPPSSSSSSSPTSQAQKDGEGELRQKAFNRKALPYALLNG